jgi:FAD binding domain
MDAPTHEKKVQSVATAVREYVSSRHSGEFFSLQKAAVPHLIPNPTDPKHRDKKINLLKLADILEIDPQRRCCIAEPGVTFEALVRETLRHNLIPLIVPELKTITVGGAAAGGAVESMSFRHGTFHDGCLEYELVTGTGEVIICSPERDPEIFGMVHSSYGTLGIITRLKFRLTPAAPFVRVDYVHFSSLDSFLEATRRHFTSQDVDFMDGIIHSPGEFLLCLGRFASAAPYTHSYDRDIYYQSTRTHETDYLTTYNYLFRYDRESFWIARNYGLENRLLRLLASPFAIGSTRMLSLARRFPFLVKGPPDVAADALIPIKNMKSFFDWYLEVFNYFPLWILPFRMEAPYPWMNPDFIGPIGDPLHIECGIYGFRQDGRKDYYRLLEEQVFELKGVKALISYNYYSESTFWKIFDKERYQRVKSATDPQNLFRDIYAKTCLNRAGMSRD